MRKMKKIWIYTFIRHTQPYTLY